MTAPSWHALLAPIPAEAVPSRKPVGTPEVLASPEGAAIAGWENVSVELTAPEGIRILMVVTDGSARPVAASDHVLFRWPGAAPSEPARMRQESIGGRIEPDGSFKGTCWLVTGPEPVDDEPPQWESTPRPPTDAEIAALRALVAEVLARTP